MISETSVMMLKFAGFEKFLAHMTFKAFGAACNLSQAILHAPNPRSKTPAPGGGCNVERSRMRRAIH
jgi:hypothetical protein